MPTEREIAVQPRSTAAAVAIPAFGAATLCMLPILGALVSPTHTTVYHLVGPASALFVPALFNLFLLTGLLTLLLLIATPTNRFGILVWSCFFFSMPWIVAKGVTTLYQMDFPHRMSLLLFALCVFCILLSTALWKASRARVYARGVWLGSRIFGLAAIFGAILTVQTCWFGWEARHLNDPATGAASSFGPKTPAPATPGHPLVLWIVFDELSHDQVFDSRYPGLELPNLDSFAAQANVFTHVVPADIYTERVLPALMGPFGGTSVRTSADGRGMHLRVPAQGSIPAHWNTFDEYKTVFADADKLGYRPAVVGWFNPYCRILADVLTSCYWTNQSELSAMFPARTIHENLFHPAMRLLADIPRFFFPKRFRSEDPANESHLHIDDYQAIRQAADHTLADPSLDFLMLHLPIPHPNGIYDRRHNRLTTGPSTYIDNLALVDRYLGHVRQVLEEQHEWDGATVIIMGDHSWRTKLLWITDPRWSAEEQRASHGGKFDDRPFYALKLPHQTTAALIDTAFHATDTQALLDALLARQITSPQQLEVWTQAHGN
jgi:hypothetical protein